MTLFVTGGAGFIGSELVRQLIRAGERVVTIDKLTYAGNSENLREISDDPLHNFVRADICDTATLGTLFRGEPTPIGILGRVFHSSVFGS